MYIDGLISVSRELSRGLSAKLDVGTQLTGKISMVALSNVSLNQVNYSYQISALYFLV